MQGTTRIANNNSLPVGTDDFLDTIPEDQSVAQQRISNLSTASAVASSDSSRSAKVSKSRRKRQPQISSPGSVSGASDANALCEGGQDDPEQSFSSSQKKARGSHSSSAVALSRSKRRVVFYSVLLALIVAISVGVWFIVSDAGDNDDDDDENSGPPSLEIVPGANDDDSITFPPGFAFVDTYQPSPSPSFNLADIEDIVETLLEISSTQDFNDPTTPQGQCRYWMTHIDQMELRVDIDGEEAVQQRYIMCVLYEAMGGLEWTDPSFLNPNIHECDWEGVSCDTSSNKVAVVYLRQLNLQGSIPLELTRLFTLKWLNLGENRLTGSIPKALMQMPELIRLDLSSNQLLGSIPVFGNSDAVSPLEVLYLDDNQMTGIIPLFRGLKRLFVQQNLFTDFDIGYAIMPTLTKWKMYNNRLTGPLPQVWDAPNLFYVDFGLNDWAGTIPESLWNLPAIESLILPDAQLTGTLPDITASLSWKYMWLHSNRLTGSIPSTWGANWNNVTDILLHDNLLTGAILVDHCNQWPSLERLEMDCQLPTLDCACCSKCHGFGGERQ